MARGVRDSKSAVAKARVVAQARIKDLEDKMSTLNRDMTLQVWLGFLLFSCFLTAYLSFSILVSCFWFW